MRLSQKIVLATTNPGKLAEMRHLVEDQLPGFELVSADQILRNADKLGLAEVYDTYFENCAAKARLAGQGCHYPTLADDTGLEVDALGGKPGVKSARYAKAPTGAKLSKLEQDRANIEMLLSELKKSGGSRDARFVTTLALLVEGILVHATGTLEGTIAEAPRGTNGFGYDPIFIPRGSQKTLAEMSESEKNAISHRARAVQELVAQIKARGIVLAKP